MPLSQELRKRFAAHVGADESATEDALFAALIIEMDARKQDIETLGEAKLTLTRERDEFKAKADTATLALSSKSDAPAQPDDFTLSLLSRQIKSDKAQAIASGAISQAGADAIDALFLKNGKPTTLALSRTEGDTDPLVCRIYEVLKTHAGNGIKHGNGVDRTTIAASRTAAADGVAADLGNDQPDAAKDADEGRKAAADFQAKQLAARGMTAA